MFAVNVSALVNLGILWFASATILGLLTGRVLARANDDSTDTIDRADTYAHQPHVAA